MFYHAILTVSLALPVTLTLILMLILILTLNLTLTVTLTENVTENEYNISNIHLCLKKGYHPTTNDNFNNSCPIPVIFGTNIAE